MIKDTKIIRILTPATIILGFINNIFISDDITYNAFESLPFFANFQYKIITMPELFIAMIILFAYTIILSLYDENAADGFNKVYCSDEDLIAVIDSTVYRITIVATKSLIPDTEQLLEIIKSKK